MADTRFRVIPPGRRSGKTELAKRFCIMEALSYTDAPDGWFVLSAPTHAQAKRIFWRDTKAMIPPELILGKPREAEMTVRLINGAEISVLGMDTPERIEGRPLDGIVLDEYANMKEGVWQENLRPALSTRGRPGWAWFTGVPEGRNHYYRLAMMARREDTPDWSYHHWTSAEILDPAEIASARADMDELTFIQEYEGSFVNFSGRCYYSFTRETHCHPVEYDPNLPLILSFDFNVSPGVCVIAQEQQRERHAKYPVKDLAEFFTAIIGEVHIPQNSNTPAVCRKIAADWSHHKGDVLYYGDATGGAKGTAQVIGSDWEIIKNELKPVFGSRLRSRVPRSNPRERVRINAMNTRLTSADGEIHMLVHETKAPFVVTDLEGVILLEGGGGEIDKRADPNLTHLSDALGYYIEKSKPLAKRITTYSTI
jgi:hypothetical protein